MNSIISIGGCGTCCKRFHMVCLFRKQLEGILENLKEKPDVGTLLLVKTLENLYYEFYYLIFLTILFFPFYFSSETCNKLYILNYFEHIGTSTV